MGEKLKTLREHHYDLMMQALQDDPRLNSAQKIIACEMMALELGWEHVCDAEIVRCPVNFA